MKRNVSDRKKNIRTAKANIDRTQQNMEAAGELAAETADPALKAELARKNGRREQALDGLQREVKADAKHHKPGR